jgi:hypothetical protein
MRRAFRDGIKRRSFLRVGAASVFGLGVNFSDICQLQAFADNPRNDLSLIYVFLRGGLSTIDTFDMKPDAPSDIRGPFDSISASLPGLEICEHLPRTAQQVDKFSIIRSFTHPNSNHGQADHYMLTGRLPGAGFNGGLTPNNQHPSFGSTIANQLGPRGPISPYLCLPTMHPSAGASYLGANAAPFVINADPNSPGFSVPDLVAPVSFKVSRLEARQKLLKRVDRFQQSAEVEANVNAQTVNVFRQKAVDLMSSFTAKQAFDIHKEPSKLRDQYGRSTLGQSCLMARRLVEAGVRCVTIDHSNWDTHYDNFNLLKEHLLPDFDAAIPTLFADLQDRGLLKQTLVIVTGEFGRTPRINKDAGRDHWGPCFSVLLGGGGIQGGRVLGQSDKWAERPADSPYGPEDLAATLFNQMGINPQEEFKTAEGRPVAIVNGGRVIRDLL